MDWTQHPIKISWNHLLLTSKNEEVWKCSKNCFSWWKSFICWHFLNFILYTGAIEQLTVLKQCLLLCPVSCLMTNVTIFYPKFFGRNLFPPGRNWGSDKFSFPIIHANILPWGTHSVTYHKCMQIQSVRVFNVFLELDAKNMQKRQRVFMPKFSGEIAVFLSFFPINFPMESLTTSSLHALWNQWETPGEVFYGAVPPKFFKSRNYLFFASFLILPQCGSFGILSTKLDFTSCSLWPFTPGPWETLVAPKSKSCF